MSLASMVPAIATGGTHADTHHPNTSFLKLNSKARCPFRPWRLKPLSTTSQEIRCSNTDRVEAILADQLKPLDTDPSTCDAHDLKQGPPGSKSVWVNPNRPRSSSVLTLERQGHTKNHTWSPRIAELRLFAKKLDSSEPTQDPIFEVLDSLEEPLSPRDAMVIMNNIQGGEKAYYFFQWLKQKEGFEMDSVIYNVTMKVLRSGRKWDRVEELLQDMMGRGVKPNNITYSTVISCARQCNLPHKAVEWFERMSETGCVPDEVTYTAVIDAYGRAGKVQKALSLYQRARADGWCPDNKAFSILLKMFSITGDFDGAYYIFQEMKALRVKPNLVAYNTMLDVLAKVGKPLVAKAMYKEMIKAGLLPNQVTLSSLLMIYGKARWIKEALKLWDKMKKEGCKKDLILYNSLLSICADTGSVKEAVMIFEEMHQSDDCKPDGWSYATMIDLYANEGQVEEATRVFNEMIEAGFRHGVVVCTCLVRCYGRAKRFDDVVRIFNRLLDEGIVPDDKLCGSLLSVLILCEKEERGKVLECIQKVNPKLASVVKMLQEEEIALVHFQELKEELKAVFSQAPNSVRKALLNCLIDLCYEFNFPERAHILLDLGTKLGVYTNLHTKSPTEWCLNLRTLSFKAALTAFDGWISSLCKAFEAGEEIPPLLGIQTGHGKKHSFDQGLVAPFRSHLRELDSPFERSKERVGWFFATRDATILWLQLRKSSMSIAT